MNYIKQLWPYIIMVILAICLTFFYSQWNSSKAELEALKAKQNVKPTIEKIEKNSSQIIYRESNVYPQIDDRLTRIEKLIRENSERNKDEIQKADINTIARKFTYMGYSSAIAR